MKRRFNSMLCLAPVFLVLSSNVALGFYDPNLQRWINRDPLGEQGFETLLRHPKYRPFDEPNLFTYVQNCPLNEFDPFGLHTAADCEAWKEICDDDCRSMPTRTRWQRYLKQACWAKCMTEYAACLSTTTKALCYAGGALAAGTIIVLFPPAAPVVLAPVGL